MSFKINERLDVNLEPFEKGLYFASPKGQLTDLNDLKVLNVAVDTIKQFYKGTIDRFINMSLDRLSDDGGVTQTMDDLNNQTCTYFRHFKIPFDAKISRMGKMSGYQYKIQNNEIGIIILLKSFHKPIDEETSHCKIELSPHFLSSHTPSEAQRIMDDIANLYLENPVPCGVAPHLCVDVQGWEMPKHMQDDIITRSKCIRTYNGIDTVKFDGFDNVLTTYGRNETLMVGNANALQTSIYRKDLEIIKSDKVDYYHEVWDSYSLGGFDKELSVTRFEERFHHSIIKEFQRGIGEDINSYLEVSQYFNELWLYSLRTIRYQINDTIAPIFQFLMEDITFNENDIRRDFKRQQKPKQDTTAIARNIGLFIGNYITIRARAKIPCRQLQKEIKNMALMEQIRSYLLDKCQDEGAFFEDVRQRYLHKLIASKYS